MRVYSSNAFKSLYVPMCACLESWNKVHALSITKKTPVWEKKKKKRTRQDETKQYVSPSPLSKQALTSGRKTFHCRAAWSKREFVQSNFILTFLAFFSSKHNPPALQQPGKSIHRSMQSTGLYALVIWAQWTKRRQATDQMVTKSTNEIQATHACMHEETCGCKGPNVCMQSLIHWLHIHTHIRVSNWAYKMTTHRHVKKCAKSINNETLPPREPIKQKFQRHNGNTFTSLVRIIKGWIICIMIHKQAAN